MSIWDVPRCFPEATAEIETAGRRSVVVWLFEVICMPARLTIVMLAQRWGVARRTIERKIHAGEIPEPKYFLGHRSWPLDDIRAFEREHFGKELA